MPRKKVFKKAGDLPTREVNGKVKVEAPDADHVNDPAYVAFREERASGRRPEHVE
jgi:hypothetical protein